MGAALTPFRTLAGIALLCFLAGTDGHTGEVGTKTPGLVDSRLLHGVFPPDPKGVWRIITQTDETSTSTCIGDPVTPLCAIQTSSACVARSNGDLCTVAYGPYLGEPVKFSSPSSKHHWRKHRVHSVRLATKADLFRDYDGIDARRVGDLLVWIEWESCSRKKCRGFKNPVVYTVRRLKDRWAVVHVAQIHYE